MELYGAYLRFFVFFPLVMVLAYFGLRFLLPRYAPLWGVGRNIQVLEKVALHSRAHLYVVRAGEDYLLLAVVPGNVTLLKDLGPDWAAEYLQQETGAVDSRGPEALSFTGLWKKLKDRGNNAKGPDGQG